MYVYVSTLHEDWNSFVPKRIYKVIVINSKLFCNNAVCEKPPFYH